MRSNTGTDASKWYVEKINYADRLWDSADDLLAWYEANNRTTPGFAPFTPRKRPYGTAACCRTPTCRSFVAVSVGTQQLRHCIGATPLGLGQLMKPRKLRKCIPCTLPPLLPLLLSSLLAHSVNVSCDALHAETAAELQYSTFAPRNKAPRRPVGGRPGPRQYEPAGKR